MIRRSVHAAEKIERGNPVFDDSVFRIFFDVLHILKIRTTRRLPDWLFYVEFTFLNCFFDGFLNQLAIPFIGERRFVPYNGLNLEFQLVVAGFTNVPVGHVEVITSHNGSVDDIRANITGQGLHIILLVFKD